MFKYFFFTRLFFGCTFNILLINLSKKRLHLITRNLQEVLGTDIIKNILQNEKRSPTVYWGTACTGKPHIGYFTPIIKIADLLRADCEVIILIADLHAYLDNMKAQWDLLEYRSLYYRRLIEATLKAVGISTKKLKFILGSSYELNEKYTKDVYKLMGIVSEHDAKKAGAEVVKQTDNPTLSGLVYPVLQALDEQYLQSDCQLGGLDQRKIFIFAEKYLPAIGYKKRAHLLCPMIPGLTGTKMSSSDEVSKIDLLDDRAAIERKIKRAFCEERNVHNNPLLVLTEKVLLPAKEMMSHKNEIVIERPEKYGGKLVFKTFHELKTAYASGCVHPLDLKKFVVDAINSLTTIIRKEFLTPENVELTELAYGNKPPSHGGSKLCFDNNDSPVTTKH